MAIQCNLELTRGTPIHTQQERIRKLEMTRVMTLEEVLDEHEFTGKPGEKTRPIWIERKGYEIEAFILYFTPYKGENEIINTFGTGAYTQLSWKQNEYNKTWRCWTSLPIDKQRKAMKWE